MKISATFILFTLMNLYASQWALAQQIYLQSATTSGGTAAGAGGKVSYSIGQAFYLKNNGSGGIASQGVIQLLSGFSDPLPISLLSFVAVYNPDYHAVDITWFTTTEINNNYFNIERSHDGVTFYPIGYKDGAGNSNTLLRYDFTDTDPLSGISYYRLKQTDYDGSFAWSPVVSVSINGPSVKLTVFPNPATNYIHIRLDNSDFPDYTWELLSLNGRMVMNGHFNGSLETLYLGDLPTGTWLLRISRDGYVTTLRIIKK